MGDAGGEGADGLQALAVGQGLGLGVELLRRLRLGPQKHQLTLRLPVAPAGAQQKEQQQRRPSDWFPALKKLVTASPARWVDSMR